MQALGAEQDKAVLQRADTMQRAAGLLESLHGAARGVLPHTQAAVFAQVTRCACIWLFTLEGESSWAWPHGTPCAMQA